MASPKIELFGSVVSIRLPWLLGIAFSLGLTAYQLAPEHHVDHRTAVWYANALILVCGALVSIVVHEAAHTLVSHRLGQKVERVSLYPLGGVAEDYNDPGTPLADALIAGAGPVASLLLAGLFGIAWLALSFSDSLVSHDLLFLAFANLILAIANLLPGYPLDGGRIFRAFVWYLHDDFAFGTRVAVAYGQGISTFALAVGLVIVGSQFSWSAAGLWVILAAWAVTRTGRQEVTRSLLISAGTSLTAGEAVRGLNPHVRADQPLDEVLEVLLAEIRAGPALVTEDSAIVGVISLNELRRYRRSEWLSVPARAAMVPVSVLPALPEQASIRDLLNEFADQRIETLVVVGENGIAGVLDRRVAMEKLLERVREARVQR
ncbi:MAG TPA: site-2 protease family protein [Nitrolancea sp.]|nr:site-2 protease family protein [Nitrolancea sp.]